MVSSISILLSAIFPIVSWLGPVIHSPSYVNYAEMRECGFTHTINVYHNFNDVAKDLSRAEKNGIKVFVYTPRILDSPETCIPLLSKEKALAGYFLSDEPSYSEISSIDKLSQKISKIDRIHPCYINMHPYYDDNQLKIVGAKTYKQYVRKVSEMNTPILSFDYYSITKKGQRPTWFNNMTMIRNESVRSKKTFWGFILSTPHSIYDTPTLSTMRLQAYVNLAYGAQGLVYFTYMTPKPYAENDFHNAPIDEHLKKTSTYSLVQAMNRELQGITPLFLGAKITKIHHIESSILFTQKLDATIQNISSIKAWSSKGILVTEMTKNHKDYLLLVNMDYEKGADVEIVLKNNFPKRLNKKLRSSALSAKQTIPAGDMLIVSLN